jgi:hypothetical protein
MTVRESKKVKKSNDASTQVDMHKDDSSLRN